MPHSLELTDEQLLAQCTVDRLRRSGPGGQHRNKVETAVRLHHRETGVVAEASERRSQPENLKVALKRLRVALAISQRSPWSSPSQRWQTRVRNGRVSIQSRHPDVPLFLAEALDCLEAHAWNGQEAAAALGCSLSQLVKLLRMEPAALTQLNQARIAAGKPPLN